MPALRSVSEVTAVIVIGVFDSSVELRVAVTTMSPSWLSGAAAVSAAWASAGWAAACANAALDDNTRIVAAPAKNVRFMEPSPRSGYSAN